jgi:hypothetical protein
MLNERIFRNRTLLGRGTTIGGKVNYWGQVNPKKVNSFYLPLIVVPLAMIVLELT